MAINVSFKTQAIRLTVAGTATWAGISGKPTATAESSFLVSGASPFAWLIKTLTQVKSLLALTSKDVTADAVQTPPFADPLPLDGSSYKDFKVDVSASTTVNLTGIVDGDAGSIELIISGAGGYTITMGTMFTKKMEGSDVVTTTGADNLIVWMKSGTDILYTIMQTE